MEQKLAMNQQSAKVQSGDLFQVAPYEIAFDHEIWYAGCIIPAEPGPVKRMSGVKRCLIKVAENLKKEIQSLNFPGELEVRLIQGENLDWMAVVASKRFLISAYLRLKNAEVQAMLSAAGLVEQNHCETKES